MVRRTTRPSTGKHRLAKLGCGGLILVLVLVVTVIYLAMGAASKRRSIDGCAVNALLGTAAVNSVQWRVPLGQVYTVATTTTATRLDLAAADSHGNSAAGPVLASQAGTVTAITTTTLTIDHGQGISITYSGMAPASATKGTKVGVGQVIGQVAAGHVLSLTATHDGKPIDPKAYLTAQGVKLDGTKPPAPLSQDAQKATGATGAGFNLPAPGEPRQASLHNAPVAIPANIKALYEAAGKQYGLPWTLLAGIGMEETNHGAENTISSAGAVGLMQFMPDTWGEYGVDGDGDGKKTITSDADSIFAAAHYLVAMGATQGEDGVRKALFAYNHAQWYVNDVLYYAQTYGGGNVTMTPANTIGCPTDGDGNSDHPIAMGPVQPGQISANLQAMNQSYLAWIGDRGVDPGNWFVRECVSWAGYFVRSQYPAKYGNFNNNFRGAEFGNAKTWASGARDAGLPIDSTPAVGSIGVRTSGRAGHVAAVIGVNPDGTFTIAEYNHVSHHGFSVRTNVRVGNDSDDFLYFIHFER